MRFRFIKTPGWECAAKATHAVELYSAKDGLAHGDLSGLLYVCPMHLGAGREEEWENRRHAEHVTPYVRPIPLEITGDRSCGDLSDYREVTEEESVDWIKKLWPGGAVPDGSPVVEEPSGYPTVTVECAGHVLLSGSLQKYALKGQIAAPEGHELLTFVYRDPFDPADPTAARPVRRARLVVEELGIVAQVETQDVEGPAQDVVSRGRFVGCDDCGSVTTCAPAERCWRGNPEANLPVDQADDEDDQDVGGPEVQLLVDSKVHAVGTLDEVKAAVAELVTTLLVANPVSLAEDAGNLNRVFNDGTVFDAVTEHGRWWTLFGVATPQPVRIEVNRR
jgi:hypothetical protein